MRSYTFSEIRQIFADLSGILHPTLRDIRLVLPSVGGGKRLEVWRFIPDLPDDHTIYLFCPSRNEAKIVEMPEEYVQIFQNGITTEITINASKIIAIDWD